MFIFLFVLVQLLLYDGSFLHERCVQCNTLLWQHHRLLKCKQI
ncbi:hypothetical protein AAZV13_01G162500 [Glycine max]